MHFWQRSWVVRRAKPAPKAPKELELTADDVALFLGLSPDTIVRYARSGRLRGDKVCRRWRFSQRAVAEAFGILDVLGPGGRPIRLPMDDAAVPEVEVLDVPDGEAP